ncbi:MAG: hypothetical protein V1645_04895 [archaeon]
MVFGFLRRREEVESLDAFVEKVKCYPSSEISIQPVAKYKSEGELSNFGTTGETKCSLVYSTVLHNKTLRFTENFGKEPSHTVPEALCGDTPYQPTIRLLLTAIERQKMVAKLAPEVTVKITHEKHGYLTDAHNQQVIKDAERLKLKPYGL